jgi:septum formation protein
LVVISAATTDEPNTTGLSRKSIVLASTSAARREMLERAGLEVQIDPPQFDEKEFKRSTHETGVDAANLAASLAERKASSITRRHAGVLVIGADQVLECEGEVFDKPDDLDIARTQLHTLSARRHDLVSAVCIIQDGERLWQAVDKAQLWMRPLGEVFIESYLRAVGDAALAGPGGYQVEGLGVQLFQRIEGNYFTILGLPLLPLLDYLRKCGVLMV